MLVTITRVLKFAMQGLWRNVWLTVATVTILSLSLITISALSVISTVSNEALSRLEQRIDISVYLKPQLKEADISAFKQQIEGINGVKTVTLISSEEALKQFKARYQDNQLIAESLMELGVNPLGASFSIKSISDEGYQSVLRQLQDEKYKKYIQEARFEDYRRVIVGISDLSNKAKSTGYAVSLVFLVISLLVVFNTIRMNIYTHREEIGIMRLVGASSWFIRAPLLVEAMFYSFIASLVTMAVFFPSLGAIKPYIGSLFNDFAFDIVGYYQDRSLILFAGIFVCSSVLSMVASTIAMRKYLRT